MYEIEEVNNLKQIVLPQYFWYGRDPLPLYFPEEWDIHVCQMAGDALPVLTQDQIEQKINSPVGTDRLEELAKGKKEVAIVVDDLTRPTEASLIIPHVLKAIKKAGIPDNCIRFLIALGSHGAHTAEDFRKKLGEEIVENFGAFNHNCYENCTDIGQTSSGMRLKINAELMQCDLKIGIGAILPHIYVGYSGGGKLFLPGMSDINTMHAFHSFLKPEKMGKEDSANPMVKEIEDAVRLIGIDFKIDVLVNTQGQMIDLFAGDCQAQFKEGIKKASQVYLTDKPSDMDIIVSNAHIKVNEGDIALLNGIKIVKAKEGSCVLILNSPTGQMTHYLMRRFGKFIGGKQAVTRVRMPEETDIFIYSKYKDTTTFDPIEDQARFIWKKDWSGIIDNLVNKHGLRDVRVGIIPDGTIQYFAST